MGQPLVGEKGLRQQQPQQQQRLECASDEDQGGAALHDLLQSAKDFMLNVAGIVVKQEPACL